jgi:phospholipid N-methyltransferase
MNYDNLGIGAKESPFGLSLRAFLKEPTKVGSAFSASQRLVDSVLEPLDWQRIRTVVEFGPGAGPFTAAMLERLDPAGRLIAFETSADFASHLRNAIDDPRLRVLEASAELIGETVARESVDCIVSGIPFSTLPYRQAERIMAASWDALKPGGQFVAYQMRRDVEALLRARFAGVEAGFEWRNIPPCHLYWATKGRRQAGEPR